MYEATQKVQACHLKKKAFLYIRQSTMQQVVENTMSTNRQYALRQRAIALGWPLEHIVVIDNDQGKSGARASEREGFKRLVTEVSMNRAGIVMGLEVSRLARNSSDWYRLLEICALTQTLLLDEDGIYDPSHFNDRLLLGLKGTMSEAELHVLRARLRGGLLQKARRGELGGRLPAGFAYDPNGKVVLDPDRQVQESIRHLFRTFRCKGSAYGVVKAFRAEGLKFPRRIWGGPCQGDLIWDELSVSRVTWILKNPRYAGAYFFGRSRRRKLPDGRTISKKRLPPEQWHAFIKGAHAGYISWEKFEENQKRLLEKTTVHRCDRERMAPREGPALLQGLVLCGRCGNRMTVRYHKRRGQLWPDYVCLYAARSWAEKACQAIPGGSIDYAIGALLVEVVTPLNLEVALTVQKELEERADEVERLRRQKVQRAQHEADLARRRYMQVDPDNRLVADQLEGEWNEKLRVLRQVQDEYENAKQTDQGRLDEEKRKKILSLASNFPRLWNDPRTSDRQRKRMAQLLIEDVTLCKEREIIVNVRFKGGAAKTIYVPMPKPYCQLYRTKPEVVSEIDLLMNQYSYEEVAEILNQRGLRSGTGLLFTGQLVSNVCRNHGLRSRRQRLREAGFLSTKEIGRKLGVGEKTIASWRKTGLLPHAWCGRMEVYYEPPTEEVLARIRTQSTHG